jgi:hypothetical protein
MMITGRTGETKKKNNVPQELLVGPMDTRTPAAYVAHVV